jgi:hypothetical protein
MLLMKGSSRRSPRPRVGVSMASLLLVAASAIGTGSNFVKASPGSPADTPTHTLSGAQGTLDEVETVVLTLRPQGITPRRVVRREGRFLLTVDNRTDVEKLVLRLEQSDGTSLRVIEIPPTAIDWGEALDLAPGEYRLVEVEHPDWECFIEIKPRP